MTEFKQGDKVVWSSHGQDDTPGAIKHRLDEYEAKTAPLIEWYSDRDLLAVVDGEGALDEVTKRVTTAIDARRQA